MKTKIKVIIITAIVSILLSIGFILLPDKQEKIITDSSITTTQVITEVSTTTQTTTATTEKKRVVKKTVKKKPQDKEAYKAYAHQLVIENGWSENDYNDLVKL